MWRIPLCVCVCFFSWGRTLLQSEVTLPPYRRAALDGVKPTARCPASGREMSLDVPRGRSPDTSTDAIVVVVVVVAWRWCHSRQTPRRPHWRPFSPGRFLCLLSVLTNTRSCRCRLRVAVLKEHNILKMLTRSMWGCILKPLAKAAGRCSCHFCPRKICFFKCSFVKYPDMRDSRGLWRTHEDSGGLCGTLEDSWGDSRGLCLMDHWGLGRGIPAPDYATVLLRLRPLLGRCRKIGSRVRYFETGLLQLLIIRLL